MSITITAVILLIVGTVVGALIWAFAKGPKLQEAGRLTFFAFLLALCIAIGLVGHTLRI